MPTAAGLASPFVWPRPPSLRPGSGLPPASTSFTGTDTGGLWFTPGEDTIVKKKASDLTVVRKFVVASRFAPWTKRSRCWLFQYTLRVYRRDGTLDIDERLFLVFTIIIHLSHNSFIRYYFQLESNNKSSHVKKGSEPI